eukprot:gene21747-26158_t
MSDSRTVEILSRYKVKHSFMKLPGKHIGDMLLKQSTGNAA